MLLRSAAGSLRLIRLTMDRLLSAHQAGWLERSFVAESSGAEVDYFALSGVGVQPANRARPRCFLPPPGRCYSFGVPVVATPRERVRAARLKRTLQRRLEQAPWGARGRVLPLLCYSRDGALLEKGFLIQDEQGLPETRAFLEELLAGLLLPAPAHLCVYEQGEGGRLGCALWGFQGAGKERELLGRANVVAAEEAEFHPAVPHLLGNTVFRSREAARQVLEECTSIIPESRLILELVDKCPKQPKKGNFPVIVIEGLDATGKTTVTHFLKDSLNAVLLRTPPSCVSQWRKIFDDEPPLIRRAFYALTNYIVASEIAEESSKSPVILDRYWHSTTAYAIATEITGNVQNLPPPHHLVYHWPDDLLSPDIVLLLTVSPEERARRLQGRGIEKTREEVDLEANDVFRQKVEESYRKMENPACHILDANPPKEDVAKAALHLIKNHCHFL
ncbi:UMP-CMP kinase 2, mitochondrial [Pantherophis guttatus]|uniref:UMP-CMP kinase 2, mitochondrial n=1 Tax=Pantherophis guttatus TaxID=94885 RepID=A0A6P9CUW7_PANGU|nr:UMP-CMP kinase 2, mitochondrial [Pantherophis guttatus]